MRGEDGGDKGGSILVTILLLLVHGGKVNWWNGLGPRRSVLVLWSVGLRGGAEGELRKLSGRGD